MRKVRLLAGILGLVALVSAAQQSSITQYGITWTFDKDYEVGQYCNGDWWVIGPVTVTGITNSWHTHGFTPSIGQDGSMINPDGGGAQGYDNTLGSYQASLNASLIGGNKVSASNPLTLKVNESLISTVSWLYTDQNNTEPGCPSFNGGTGTPRPVLRDGAVLTCVASAPPGGSLRPPYCGNDKSPKFNKSQLNYSLLNDFDPPASVFSVTDAERWLERPWIDHVHEYAGAFLHPSENMNQYGRDISIQMGNAALMLHVDFAQLAGSPSKETLLVRFVQLGIDWAGIADAGGSWPPNGGHQMGRKWPIMFAGLMLDDAHMKNVGSWNTIFQDDANTFHVDQAAVDMTHSAAWDPDDRAPSRPYETADIGLPEWGIRHETSPKGDNMHWSATYRSINNMSYPGFVLAAHVMGAKELWTHDAIFDYIDRSTRFGSAGYAPGEKNHEYYSYGGTFVYDLWQAHRNDYHFRWVPDDTTDVYSNGGLDSSLCKYYCGKTSITDLPGITVEQRGIVPAGNPVRRRLELGINGPFRILDAKGREMDLIAEKGIINVDNLKDGIYFVKTGNSLVKFIKAR